MESSLKKKEKREEKRREEKRREEKRREVKYGTLNKVILDGF